MALADILRQRLRANPTGSGTGALRAQADALGGELLERIRGFNPMESVQRYATGAFDSFRDRLAEDIQSLRGQQVGMGRLNTGFATEDEDRLIRRGVQDLNNSIAMQSVNAAGLDLSNIGNLGSMYGQALNRYTSERELQIAQENARRQERASNTSSILGTIGALGGAAMLAFSDERLKTNIERVGGALEQIKRMKGVEWDWNEDGQRKAGRSGRERGVLAQDVEAVRPDLVHETDDGTKVVNYTGVAGTAVEAVKELEGRLARLESEIRGRKRGRAA